LAKKECFLLGEESFTIGIALQNLQFLRFPCC
jgi:hypothetical protein